MPVGESRRWDLELALSILEVDLVGFHSENEMPAGVQGWSRICRRSGNRLMGINPDTHLPQELVAFHELGHLLMGHSEYSVAERTLARGEMEFQAMKIALTLGEDLLAESAHQWRDFAQQYIRDFEAMRHAPETEEELGMIHEAVEVIREAGLPQLVAA